MNEQHTIGLVGLGLLGRGIATSLLLGGYRVMACERSEQARAAARDHIDECLQEMVQRAGTPPEAVEGWRSRYVEAVDVARMGECELVIESITEDLAAKRAVFDALEAVVAPATPIASNTSAMPITLLQQGRRHPERFVGMHWGEPAHLLRFLEVIRGEQTGDAPFEAVVELGRSLGKEPTIVKKDVRGFVTNRLMYAMIREALHLLDAGVADAESIDRAFRTDIGWWAGFVGPLRWMDLTGLPLYGIVMRDLLPELSNARDVPAPMQRLMDEDAGGVANGKGFYAYTPEQAKAWERMWMEYTWQMHEVAKEMDEMTPRETPRHT